MIPRESNGSGCEGGVVEEPEDSIVDSNQRDKTVVKCSAVLTGNGSDAASSGMPF